MKDSKRAWVWVGIVVVVVVIAVWAISYFVHKNSKQAGTVAVTAPQGQVVAGFPKQLILYNVYNVNASSSSVADSYSYSFSSSTGQYTVNFNSSSSITSAYMDYINYFHTAGWTVTGWNTSESTFRAITAKMGYGTANIVINKVGNGSQVTVTYFTQ
jgi:hypothetical protein